MDAKISGHAAEVISWRESLSLLPDHHFFELIRMYLGEIKTPYNKQKLIEELSAFLRHEENRRIIIQLLSRADLLILSAIVYIPLPTQEKLTAFFKNEFQFADLYERFMNLEERLIIFRKTDKASGKIFFALNPLLKEYILPYLSLDMLLPAASPVAAGTYTAGYNGQVLTPHYLAAVFSFVSTNPDLCKNDGTLKKKILSVLPAVFPADPSGMIFSHLIASLRNLGLFRQTVTEYTPVPERWQQFIRLPEYTQYLYIAAASFHYPREQLFRRAQLLSEIIRSIPETGFSKSVLYRSAYLLQEQAAQESGISPARHARFSAILAKAETVPDRTEAADTTAAPDAGISNLIAEAELFGLIYKCAADENGNPVYAASPFAAGQGTLTETADGNRTENFASIDAGFSVTILPGAPLSALYPLVCWLELIRYDTASSYQITKKSCIRCFNTGKTPAVFCTEFKTAFSHEIPQSLLSSIEEWYENYNSASLYCGFMLHVSADKQTIVENNPELAQHIQKIIAPGMYLFDFKTPEEASASIEKSTLDFIGDIKSFKPAAKPLDFIPVKTEPPARQAVTGGTAPSLQQAQTPKTNPAVPGTADANPQDDSDKAAFFNTMRKTLDALGFEPEQTESLKERIRRKIIITPKQLRAESVRPEKIEASGMDFLGKVYIAEHAIATMTMIELIYDDSSAENGTSAYIGMPLSLEKRTGDTLVKICLEPDHHIDIKSIGKARSVKRIRGAIFHETAK